MLKHAVIEKRADAVIRWLERFKRSYSAGAVETALMDAECARADIEALRLDVFGKLNNKSEGREGNRLFAWIMGTLRVTCLASLVVMLAVFPISRDVTSPVIEHDRDSIVLAQPIEIIREDLPKPDTPAMSPMSSKKKTARRAVQTQTVPSEKPSPKPKPKTESSGNKTVAYDKVFSLMQTGQRALKNNNTVIKIK